MTEVVLPQLVEAEAQLAAQEAALSQQLAELQEKIKGIQTVIAMFEGSAQNNGKAAAPVAAPKVEPVEEVEDEPVEAAVEAPAVEEAPPAKAPRATRGGRKKTTTAAKKATPKAKASAPAPKASKRGGGKSSNWQRYVRDDFSKTPLPDIVENILKAQPKNSFKIAEVMSEIFPEDMPKAQFLKARNRISNILSAGARSGEWYRGRGGTYSCTEKALKAS